MVVALYVRHKTSEVGISSVSLENLKYYVNASSPSRSPSFRLVLNTQIFFKNKFITDMKFKSSTAKVSYRGIEPGEASIRKLKVEAIEKFNTTIYMSSDKVPSYMYPLVGRDINSGKLSFVAYGKFKTLLNEFPYLKGSARMNCSFVIHLGTQKVNPLSCKL
ncbi:hypothetical protein PanWU01x14_002160 [Parasponia andersonii]|uniref:Late embryogenesis abundant protein n=1 Tax=Parasponia andersonii TaxID=3476 RepID=A0A2P5E590_PARAD|nr:hypothetical protein PanWU01x14_002160 [Parasponia andersonii]